ncbi:MAG: hypothetical protein PHN73_03475 [Eubacteriales bacterium]|nr:hypothetical protein [Eubacteriales bacterium]
MLMLVYQSKSNNTTIFLGKEMMQLTSNKEIREKMQRSRIKYWEVALALGITDGTFSRKLRKEFSEEDKKRVLQIIDQISRESNV